MRHAFTTKRGGVSTGACESMNLGFGRGDDPENVRRNYHILADALSIPYERITMTKQVHRDAVTVVTEETAGMGLTQPMAWESDALVTNLPNTPLAGFYADCVVTLLSVSYTHLDVYKRQHGKSAFTTILDLIQRFVRTLEHFAVFIPFLTITSTDANR